MKSPLYIFLFLCTANLALCQSSVSASELLAESIKYHDPKGKLSSKSWMMAYEDKSYFKFDPRSNDFEVKRVVKSHEVILMTDKGKFIAKVDGSTNFTNEKVEEKYTSEERGMKMRNYYHYLWYLPMKLNDPGTIIDDEVKSVDFFGKSSLQIRVSYTPKVGKDIWYFYFNPNSKALQGYRFYHDESANDGEYILLDGEVEYKGVRIPQTRKWYTHKEDKFLGEDKLVKLILN